MTDFDLDLNGAGELSRDFSDLADKGDGDAVYVVGTNVEYAVYLEFGTRHMPPYPFFRPAIREFQANPERFIIDNTSYPDIEAIPNANALVGAVSLALENQMKRNATAGAFDRSPGTDAEHPKVQTGNLRADISAVKIR